MFKWFNWNNFMDTPEEWHAFIEGFCETFCFWRARYEPSEELLNDLRAEHHYYVAGRVIGFIALVVFGLVIVRAMRSKAARKINA